MANPSNSNETNNNNNNNANGGGTGVLGTIASQTREYIHEAVKTPEQREAERQEAETTWTEQIPAVARQVGQRLQERAAEDAGVATTQPVGAEPPAQEKPNLLGLGTVMDVTKNAMDQTRTSIYNATKSPAEIEQEKEAQKTLMEKVKDQVPGSAAEAGQRIGQAIDNGVESVKTKFQERLDEDD